MARLAVWIAALAIGVSCAGVARAQDMTLTSTDIKEGATIADEQLLNGFGCTGRNVSPQLSWSGAPAGTKSYAIQMFDPDAPTGSGFWHWVVFNIPPTTTSLPKGAGDVKKKLMPKGAIQSRTDLGTAGYGGPCPRPATSHTATRSRFSRSMSTSSRSPRTATRPAHPSASTCISMRWRRRH